MHLTQRIQNPIIRRLLLQTLIPRTSSSIPLERIRHPRVLNRPIPNRNTHAALRISTSPDKTRIIRLLLLQIRILSRGLHAHIQLGVCNLNIQRRVGLERAGQIFPARGVADGEVALQTDAVDLGVVGFDQFDDVLGGGCFVAGVFNAVVVVVELRGWVCGGGGSEGDGDVGFADGFVEDVLAVGAVVVEGCTLLTRSDADTGGTVGHTFVNNIPGNTLALVVSNHLGDMVLHGLDECLVGPGSTSDCMVSISYPHRLGTTRIPQLGNC